MSKPTVDTNKPYASTGFTVDDLLALRPKWTDEECAAWLQENERQIASRLSELGFEVIEDLLFNDKK